jgi:hypothetical protein
MKKRTKSILHELNSMVIERDREHVFENRAENIITSASNFIDELRVHFTEEQASELERRLINSIRAQDPAKFRRGIRSIRRLQ